jgi:uncharacterized protein YkwD
VTARGDERSVGARALATAVAVVALVSGCGGGADRSANPPVAPSGGPAAAVNPSAGMGRLGGALLARPGKTSLRGHVQRITGDLAGPRSNQRGVGAEANCQDTTLQPTPSNLAQVADVIFCLMNAMRANAGLPPLTQQDQLARASLAHSQDMVANRYFAHDALDGRDVVARLTAGGYIPQSGDWIVGENLAWGSGALATPAALVNAWMNSAPHRDNLLAPDFQQVGMGVVYGTPSADAPDGVTVTTDFGTRLAPARPTYTSAVAPSPSTPARAATLRRKRALRRCSHRSGAAKRRCVTAARKVR